VTAIERTDALEVAIEQLTGVGRRVHEAEAALKNALSRRTQAARDLWPQLHHLGPTTIAHEIDNLISGPHLRQLTHDLHPRPRRGAAPRGEGRPSAEDRTALEQLQHACAAVVDASSQHARTINDRTSTIRRLWPLLQPLGAARIAREVGHVIGEATIRSATADLQRMGRL
jgi:hypothetical protein